MLSVDREQARHYLVNYHGLDKRLPRAHILEVFHRLHSIQVDPLQVIGRSHDLALKARLEDYQPRDLEQELYRQHTLVEGWDKMLSLFPIQDRALLRGSALHYAEAIEARARQNYGLDLKALADKVRPLLAQGPLLNAEVTRAFNISTPGNYGGLHVLNYLYYTGQVEIVGKKHNHKMYALMDHDQQTCRGDDVLESSVLRRIESCGLIRQAPSDAWLGHEISKRTLREPAIKRLLEKEMILEAQIQGVKSHCLLPATQKNALLSPEQSEQQVRFLAPLDNFLWDRTLLEALFDFHYRWEVYVPKAKRQYGYYVLPILCGAQLVGRIEPKRARPGKSFEIEKLWWESGKTADTDAFNQEVDSFRHFLRKAEEN